MKIGRIVFGLLLVSGLAFTSCGDDEGSGNNNVNCTTWSTEYASILLDLANAAEAWNNTPSPSTCQNLIDAYDDAINAMESFLDSDCIPEAQQPAIDAAIASWNTAKNAVDCSQAGQ